MNSELQNCQQTEPCTVEEIRNSLEQSEKGKVYNTAANYKRVLQYDPLLKGAIRKNLLTERIDIVKSLGWYRDSPTLTDVDVKYWCCTIKVDIENSKSQYIEKDKQEATKDGSESTKIQHGI